MQTLRVLRRRWYIALPLVLLTLVGSVVVRAGVQPGYTASASVLILPPSAVRVQTSNGVEIQPVNPLLGISSSTLTATQALSILAGTPAFRERATSGVALATYQVTAPSREPILGIQVESDDQEVALTVTQRVIDELVAELERQQPSALIEQRLGIQTLAPPAIASVDNSQLRSLVVALAVGFALTLVVTILADRLIAGNDGRRHRRTFAGNTAVAPEPAPDAGPRPAGAESGASPAHTP